MNNTFTIINGTLIDPAGKIHDKLNILISNGKIEKISTEPPSKDIYTIDAAGKIVTPGFIDMHVHLRDPGYEYKEDIASGGKAAAAGGFTTICCMPNTKPVNDNAETTKYIFEKAGRLSPVHIIPISAISMGLKGTELADLTELKAAGVIAISDDGASIQNPELMKAGMIKAKELDLLVISHPEDISITKDGVMNAGQAAKKLGLPGIPPEAEESIIKRDIDLARETGARLHIAHVSSANGIELVRSAKKEGLLVTCEVTPHHLFLNENDIGEANPNMKMNPPLRRKTDNLALIAGLKDGTVNAIATDHAPHAENEKKDFLTAAFGIIGMEQAFPLCYRLVDEIGLNRLIELFTIGPATVLKLNMGSLGPGRRADITIIDPNKVWRVDPTHFHSKSRNCPFIGWELTGQIEYTISSGQIAYQSQKN